MLINIDSIAEKILSKNIDKQEALSQFESLSVEEKNQLISQLKVKISGNANVEASQPLFFQESWYEQPLTKVESKSDNRQFIIFTDNELQERIVSSEGSELFANSLTVRESNSFKELTARSFYCCFNSPTDIQKVFNSKAIDANVPISIIYTWGKGRGELGVHSIFNLFKVINESTHPITHVILVGKYDPLIKDACWDYSWIGFERSLKLLLPKIKISLLYTNESCCTLQQLLDATKRTGIIRYQNSKRYVLLNERTEIEKKKLNDALKHNGGYLITGGCGALGLKIAHYLAEKYNAKLLLLGRKPLSSSIQEKIDLLKRVGAKEVEYQAVDISDEASVKSWSKKIPFNLSGVIHAAGVDSPLAFYEKSVAQINEVLQPKSIGTILLDEALVDHPLDFVCYFSSSSALLGDLGACDYSIGNRFQMAYAHYRQLSKQGSGKTIVINWPFWQEGGMSVGDSEQTAFYLKSSGQDPLDTATGINIWHELINNDRVQTLVMIGKPNRIEKFLNKLYETELIPQAQATVQISHSFTSKGWKAEYQGLGLKECIVSDLRQIVSDLSKIALKKLDNSSNLADYGFDSIILAELAKSLATHFVLDVSPALFYNFGTIDKLGDYFLQDYQSHIQEFYLQPQTTTVQSTHSFTGKGWKSQYQGLSLNECVVSDLRQIISDLSKIAIKKLDNSSNLADYGFDSIILAELAKALATHFVLDVSPALFYNYATIEKLGNYFVQDHQTHIQEFYQQHQANAGQNNSITPTPLINIKPLSRNRLSSNRLISKERGSIVDKNNQDPIAIVGISGRFPQARTVDRLWTLLAEGKSGITEIPLSRWDWRDYFKAPGDKNNKISTNKGGFIEGVDEFDPLFFDIPQNDAAAMDPGERLLLVESYNAIEDAGLDPKSIRGSKIGFFVGMEESIYGMSGGKQGFATTGNAMISSRVSYYLDLHGPVVATNTACSSGLVSLHQAVMSLRNGECQAALVAGIALVTSPMSYLMMSQVGMLSHDGQCFSLANKANGLGVGEAIVVLMLKPLSVAVAEGHKIYGTIKASGINFDGKTNGITAPNGQMQAELIESIYTEYGVNVSDVTHVVTHTTGTKLGDSVEINALNSAYKKLLNKQKSDKDKKINCALTSCKSNIGHTLAASGLVSVVSLLKGMEHHKIPASLNCDVPNDYIRWQDSPFYINKEIRDWEKESGQLHMGAVSSFGRSGTNAHVVIEEYQQPLEGKKLLDNNNEQHKKIIVLSAKSLEQLYQKASDLLSFIVKQKQDNSSKGQQIEALGKIDLQSMAYTLQVGRTVMEERVGFIVDSVEQLIEKIQAYINGEQNIEDVFQGNINHNNDALNINIQDDDLKQIIIEKWIAGKKFSKLLDLWVKGLDIDWNNLYGNVKPKRMSLPTYPFAREKYWIDQNEKIETAESKSEVLHPLLHRNTSDLSQLCFSSTFTGNEFFFSNHKVNGTSVLSASVYLEMIRVAIEKAVPISQESFILELNNIVWAQPIVANKSKQISIALLNDGGKYIDFEIYSHDGGRKIINCQGQAVFNPKSRTSEVNIAQLQEQMRKGKIEPVRIYETLERGGVGYGTTHQGIVTIFGGEQQLLAHLTLPDTEEFNQNDYFLHPSLMDSAFQSIIGLLAEQNSIKIQPSLPHSLESISFILPFTEKMFAWVRHSDGSSNKDKEIKIDIDLYDNKGITCVKICGLSYKGDNGIVPSSIQTEWVFSVTGSDSKHVDSMKATEKIELFLKQEMGLRFQIPAHKVSVEKSFFELGLDSITITNIIDKTNHLIGGNLLPSIVFEYINIKQLAEYIATSFPEKIEQIVVSKQKQKAKQGKQPVEQLQELVPLSRKKLIFDSLSKATNASKSDQVGENVKGKSANNLMLGNTVNNTNSIWTELVTPESSSTSYNILVPMQREGNRTPIFGMTGGGGNVLCFQPLSQALGKDQPFYGLQAVGIDGKTQPLDSIQKIAEVNIEAIRAVQKTGPFNLFGYSFGGVVAFEMARILLEQNEKISSLMLLDCLCPTLDTMDEVDQIADFYKMLSQTTGIKINIDVEKLRQISGNDRIDYLYNASKKSGVNNSKEQFAKFYNLSVINRNCAQAYKPVKLPKKIDVTLFKAIDSHKDKPNDYGWSQFLIKPVKVIDVEANHFSIIDSGPIQVVAKEIKERS